MNDFLFRWFPMVVAAIQLVFLPLVLIALDAKIESHVHRHNSDLYAHPALNDLVKLEQKIDKLSLAVGKLEVAIARLAAAYGLRSEGG